MDRDRHHRPVDLEAAGSGSADAVAALIRTSKAEAMPWLAVVHSPEEDVAWVRSVLLPQHDVVLARTGEDDGVVGWAPRCSSTRRPPATATCSCGRSPATRGPGRCGRSGFVAEEQTDGSGNEEHEPDVRHRWLSGWQESVIGRDQEPSRRTAAWPISAEMAPWVRKRPRHAP